MEELDNGEENKDTQSPGHATTLNSWSHSGTGTKQRAAQDWTHQPADMGAQGV